MLTVEQIVMNSFSISQICFKWCYKTGRMFTLESAFWLVFQRMEANGQVSKWLSDPDGDLDRDRMDFDREIIKSLAIALWSVSAASLLDIGQARVP